MKSIILEGMQFFLQFVINSSQNMSLILNSFYLGNLISFFEIDFSNNSIFMPYIVPLEFMASNMYNISFNYIQIIAWMSMAFISQL